MCSFSINGLESIDPKECIGKTVLVSEDQLLTTAIQAAKLFSQLNEKAHAATKLKVRKPHLEALENAIELDLLEEIFIN